MYCFNCGSELSDGALFCTECGMKQDAEEETIQWPVHSPAEAVQREEFRPLPPVNMGRNAPVQKGGGKTALIAVGAVALAALFAVAVYFAFLKPDGQKEYAGTEDMQVQREEEPIPEEQEEEQRPVPEEVLAEAEEPAPEEEEPEEIPQYVLPESDTVRLSVEDLQGLSQDELRIARNEIYARHGRRFQDEGLQRYFDGCDWYEGIYDPNDFPESLLNEIEMFNRDLITEYEEDMGYR